MKKNVKSQVESVNVVVANNQAVESAWDIQLDGIAAVRTAKDDKKLNRNILLISRTPKQTVRAMNGIMDEVVGEDGFTLRQRLTEIGCVVGKNGLTLKQLYAAWPWKNEKGDLMMLQTKVAKVPSEDGPDQIVYGFNAKTKKWESFKRLEVGKIGANVDFMGKEITTGWSIAMLLNGIHQMQHIAEYKTKQMEYEKAWNDAKKVYTFEKVQNKGGMNNKAKEVSKRFVEFL